MDAKRLLILITLVITIPLLVGQVPPEGSNCQNDHWNPFCDRGDPEPVGDWYYACSTWNL